MSHVTPGGHDTIFVIDFGAQYSQLIARRVRECNIYCELWPYTAPLDELLARKPKGFILSGGPASVYGEGAPGIDARLFDGDVPVLGICYGMQIMAHTLGATVRPAERREYGRTDVELLGAPELFRGLGDAPTVWMSHGDHVEAPPPGFSVSARTPDLPVAAMADPARRLYAVQFHPEVVHTPGGMQLFRNFLLDICGSKPT